MSRSYKKNMGGKIAICKSDKWNKKNWHSSARRKIRNQLTELLKFYDLEEYIKPYYDYNDVASQDVYGWSSDGGSYLKYTDQELVNKFNKELKDEKLWEDYINVINLKRKYLSNNVWWFRLLVNTKKLHKPFFDKDDMDNWMINNQNYIINVWKKINFGK